jgi:uncharacterized membrane protein YidH (DUF202 family)
MLNKKFERILSRGSLTPKELEEVLNEANASGAYLEELLIKKGIPKHEVLFCLSEYYGYPFTEYDESVLSSYFLTMHLNMKRLKELLWFPLSARHDRAEVIAYRPDDPLVVGDVRRTLGAEKIDFIIALPSDLMRIIEHNFDVNPDFPRSAGRTPLAKVRTFLADRRSFMACHRTSFAKGRTGLAFLRTGISFMTVALLLLRIFGIGYLTLLESTLFLTGLWMSIDGLKWYLPARKAGKRPIGCAPTQPTWGTTVLAVSNPGDNPVFTRTEPIERAKKMRASWADLTPVMRRRFLANDRTDLAEERTILACYRTIMAKARTGLAFARTGIAFVGLGIAFLRQFPAGPWTTFDGALIITGLAMALEGFYWYVPSRRAGREGLALIRATEDNSSIWDFVFPPLYRTPNSCDISSSLLKKSCSPGIWATTGLALERTVLADRRNVMARLRTVMARSRTGMAFVRTGMSISAVGSGLLVYYGISNTPWAACYALLIIAGLILIGDGLSWHLPSKRVMSQFPYCFGDMEITIPDYGRPNCTWRRAVFSDDTH